jgi:hypothetical protein
MLRECLTRRNRWAGSMALFRRRSVIPGHLLWPPFQQRPQRQVAVSFLPHSSRLVTAIGNGEHARHDLRHGRLVHCCSPGDASSCRRGITSIFQRTPSWGRQRELNPNLFSWMSILGPSGTSWLRSSGALLSGHLLGY